jgi:AcrR family transcriptional regulator
MAVSDVETTMKPVAEAMAANGRTVRNRKTDQILQGARRVFMEHGFEGASVDEIARAAGASKATLYSYFPDKRQLFTAVVEAGCLRQGGGVALGRLDPDEPIEAALRRIAGEFGAFVLSPGALEMFRTCIAEAGRFPELGRAFYEAGPERARSQLVALLDEAVARGELAIADTGLAADQFAALAKARVFLATLLGQPIDPDDPELARVADEAVATFLARYGARTA